MAKKDRGNKKGERMAEALGREREPGRNREEGTTRRVREERERGRGGN